MSYRAHRSPRLRARVWSSRPSPTPWRSRGSIGARSNARAAAKRRSAHRGVARAGARRAVELGVNAVTDQDCSGNVALPATTRKGDIHDPGCRLIVSTDRALGVAPRWDHRCQLCQFGKRSAQFTRGGTRRYLHHPFKCYRAAAIALCRAAVAASCDGREAAPVTAV